MAKKLPIVTFIIPTLNAEDYLPSCLKAIRSQDYPQSKIEIVIADGGSTDNTRKIATKYKAIIIENPEVLHEPGKARASDAAHGEILFFTDADNTIVGEKWVSLFVNAYLKYPTIKGFLPQTVPPPNWNSFDRYMGYLSTDPFTWFLYRWSSTPRTYRFMASPYKPVVTNKDYQIYEFDVTNHPLLGLSQGMGTVASFKREKVGHSDDILSGLKLISEKGNIVHIPYCKVYHYHVRGIDDFIIKYTWRLRNNFYQKVKGMGLVNRQKYLNLSRKISQYLFPFYSLSIIFPFIDSIKLYTIYKDPVVFWHVPGCLILTFLIFKESAMFIFGIRREPGKYLVKKRV